MLSTRSGCLRMFVAGAVGLGVGLSGCKGQIESKGLEPAASREEFDKPVAAVSSAAKPPANANANANAKTSEAGPRYVCARPDLRGTPQWEMRRLTRDEYLRSAEVLFGTNILNAPSVQRAASQIPKETSGDSASEFQNGYASAHVQGILLTAEALAAAVTADPEARDRTFGPCALKADTSCASAYLNGAARRILKRPLDDVRRSSLLGTFQVKGAGLIGLQALVAQLLQAPEAVFHLELPREPGPAAVNVLEAPEEPIVTGEAFYVDDWTVAARVSYALTGHGPDESLLDSAASGELRTEAQVRPHAIRLMGTSDARHQLEQLFDDWLGLRALPTPTQVIADAAGVDRTGLPDEARRELLDYALYEVLDRDADAQTLMTDAVGFPRSARMVKLLGAASLAGAEPTRLDGSHGGLLLRTAPLLSGQHRTSPILRGVYVRRQLLCDELPSPDFSVIQARTAAAPADPTRQSSRSITETITSPESCMVCHARINPLGFVLEQFDALGLTRRIEVAYTLDGARVAEHPIDTHVTRLNIEQGAPDQLNDAVDLVRVISKSAKYQACIARRLYSQMHTRVPTEADSCLLADVEAILRDGKSVKAAWLAAVVNAGLFLRTVPEATP